MTAAGGGNPGTSGSVLELRLFGRFEARVGGSPVPSFPSRKAQWLLALLALQPGRHVPRDVLARTLWPDSEPAKALFNLRHTLTALRGTLGPAAASLRASEPRALGLDPATIWVDARAFDALLADGRTSDLEQAIALYRAPLLADCREEWVVPERQSRQQAYLGALETLAAQASGNGDHAAATRALRLLVSADPYRESAHRALMQALSDAGDRAAVHQVFRDLRILLRQDLNADVAPETDTLYRALSARPESPAPVRTALPEPVGPPRRLPIPLSTLIGREREIEDVAGWLTKSRLVTLTGPGGVGKTRLAIAAAEAAIARFPGGVWFVDLAPLADPAFVPHAVAKPFGVREQPGCGVLESLQQALAGRMMLLVLDNCEHLLDACATAADGLLAACRNLCIVATSRQPLGIPGEQVYRVPSLSFPAVEQGRDEKEPTSLLDYPAVRLFVERATQADPSFRLRRANVRDVTEICRRLDGIPLAIEMAAARVRGLSLRVIHERLEDRFRLLTSGNRAGLPRQRTLQAAMDWSYDLLMPAERLLLQRLSVFSGGWTLGTAEAVCGEREEGRGKREECAHRSLPSDIPDLMTQLVEKSLVVFEQTADGGTRYRFLETMRQYAHERLLEGGEADTIHCRHRNFFLQLADDAQRQHNSSDATNWQETFEAEYENMRAALAWSLTDSDARPGMRLAAALGAFWSVRGRLGEGRTYLNAVLARQGTGEVSSERAQALRVAGLLAIHQHDFGAARSVFEEALEIAHALGDRGGTAGAVSHLAYIACFTDDYDRARSLYEQSLALFRELGDRSGVAGAYGGLGKVAYLRGDYARAKTHLADSLAIFRELQNRAGIAGALNEMASMAWRQRDYRLARSCYEECLTVQRNMGDRAAVIHTLGGLGHAARDAGDYVRADALYRESLVLRRETGDSILVAQALEDIAGLTARQGYHVRAVHLLGAVEAVCEAHGRTMPLADREEYHRTIDAARAALGLETFAAALAHGRSWTLAQAGDYALDSP